MKFTKAVLIIHGFAGGTYDFEELFTYLQLNSGFKVFTFTLPGHDKRIRVKKEDWIKSVDDHIKEMIANGYQEIYVIGHSMGGVLATYLAANYKQVKKLVLVAPAFSYLTVEVEKNELHLIKFLKESPKIVKRYNGSEIIGRMTKVHPSAVSEFMNLIKESQMLPEKITVPTLIIQGLADDIVPHDSSEKVYEKLNSQIKYIYLFNDCDHAVFKSKRSEEVIKIIEKFLKRHFYPKKKSIKTI